MNDLIPANNVIFAFVAGFIVTVVLHYSSQLGYTPSPDVANALPGGVALAIAHAWDMWTGENKPK